MAIKRFVSSLKYRPTENERERRARLLNIIVGGILILDILALIGTLIAYPLPVGSLSYSIVTLYLALALTPIIGGIVLALNRWTSVELASSVLLTFLVIAISLGDDPLQVVDGRTLVMFAVPILAASLLIRSWASFIFAGLSSLSILLLRARIPEKPFSLPVIIIFFALALLAWSYEYIINRAFKSSRDARAKFQLLYETMPEMVTSNELVRDDSGKVVDYRITDCNPAFSSFVGTERDRVRGLLASQLFKVRKVPHLDLYAKVVETGIPIHFEEYSDYSKRNVSVSIFSPEKGTFTIVVADITTQKLVDEAIAEHEQRLFSIYDSIGDFIIQLSVEKDGAYRLKSANSAFLKAIGLSIDQAMGKSPKEIIQEPSLSILLKNISATIRNKEIVRWEDTIDLPSGRIVGEISILPVLNEAGKCTELVGTIHDITQRKQAEESLRTSEERFSKSFFSNPLASCISDFTDGRITEANEAFLKLFEYTREEMIGRTGPELDLWVDAEMRQSLIGDLIQFGTVKNVEGQFRAKSGIIRDVLASAEVIQIDGQPHALIMVADITEIKATRDALANSEKRFRTLIENSADAIILIDPHGSILYMSPASGRMLGRDPSQRIGSNALEHIHPEDKESITQSLGQLVKNPNESLNAKFRIQHLDGEWRWMEITATNLLNDPGIQSIVLNMHDITEIKKAEEAIRHQLTELEVLAENSANLSRLLEPEEIGQKLVEILSGKLAWGYIDIRLSQPKTGLAETLAFSCPYLTAEDLQKQRKLLNQMNGDPNKGLRNWVIQHGKPVRSRRVRKDHRYIPIFPNVQSGLYVPIQLGGRTIGSIAVESEGENGFTEQDEHLLTALASQAAVAFENTRLYREAVQDSERHSILHRASREIAAAGLDLEAVFTAIHKATDELMTVNAFILGLYDPQRQDVEGVYLVEKGKRYPNIHVPLNTGFLDLIIQNRKTIRLADRAKEMPERSVFFGKKCEARSILAAPVFSGNAVIGAIIVQSCTPNQYSEEDESILEMLATYAGIAIENARLFDQTSRRANELSAISSVTSALRKSSTEEEIVASILNNLVNLLTANDAALVAYNSVSSESKVEYAKGSWQDSIGSVWKPSEGLVGTIAETYSLYESSDITQETGLKFLDTANQPEAVAGIPLLVQGQFIGSMWVGRLSKNGKKAPVPFTSDEIRMLGAIADIAANGLHRATLHKQAIQHAEQLATVNEIGHSLEETLEPDLIYPRLVNSILKLVPGLSGVTISLYDPLAENITDVCLYDHGAFVDTASLTSLPFDQNESDPRSQIFRSREPLIIDSSDYSSSEQSSHKMAGGAEQTVESEIYLPMFTRGTTTGFIRLQSETKGRFGPDETNLLTLVANTAAVAIENARLITETQKRLQNLSALHAIDVAISASVDLRVTLNILLERTMSELKTDAAAVLLYNPVTRSLEYIVGNGFRAHALNGTRMPLNSGLAGKAVLTRQVQDFSDLQKTLSLQEKSITSFDIYKGEDFYSHLAVPLIAKGQAQGVLEVFHRSPFLPEEDWLTFFNMLAGQAAIAIDNARLFESLQRSNFEMAQAYDATIQGWSQALELRDKETEGHTNRVTDLTLRLAQAIGVPNNELEHVRRGALLHDIGKMGIPDSILLKPEKLTEEEWDIMRQHPEYAFRMLSPISYLRPALDIPHYHHERWDGSGYPEGLKGDQIPLHARIFAVVDVYDALTSDRPYRPAWTVEKTLEYIRDLSGKQFDPEVVDAFMKLVSEENG